MLEKLEEVRENIFRYLEARIELFTLETRGKVEEGVIRATHGIILGFLATITLIFLLSLLAAFLNEVFDSRYLGFLVVAAFFLVLTIIWIVAKESVMGMIRKMAYKSIKASQEKKAEEKSDAVEQLMNQTRDTLNQSGPYLARE
jgi:ABC-type multidrug transport system fused ATPase/permease subunit